MRNRPSFPAGILALLITSLVLSIQADWQRAASVSGRLNCLYSNGQSVFAGTNGAAYRSSDNGTSWTKIDTGMGYRYVYAFVNHKSFLFSATDTGIFRSSNNGQRWTFCGPRSGIYDLAQDTGALFGADAGVYRSSDGGTGWTAVNSGLPGEFVWCVDVKGSYAFCGSSTGLYRSLTRGSSWGKLSSGGIPTVQFNDILFEGTDVFFASSGGVFRSTNNGTNWVFSGPISGPAWSILSYGGLMFIAMDVGVYFSSDHGLTWDPTDLSGTNLMHLAACRDTLFAGYDYSGIWRRPISEIDGSVSTHHPSSNQRLDDGPIRAVLRPDGTALVRFSLARPSTIDLSIYDCRGLLIVPSLSKKYSVGMHSITMDLKGKSTGAFFCRLRIGTEVSKLVFMSDR